MVDKQTLHFHISSWSCKLHTSLRKDTIKTLLSKTITGSILVACELLGEAFQLESLLAAGSGTVTLTV